MREAGRRAGGANAKGARPPVPIGSVQITHKGVIGMGPSGLGWPGLRASLTRPPQGHDTFNAGSIYEDPYSLLHFSPSPYRARQQATTSRSWQPGSSPHKSSPKVAISI